MTNNRQKYALEGGPFDGTKVWLSMPETLIIESQGQRGYYGRIDDTNIGSTLYWQDVPKDKK